VVRVVRGSPQPHPAEGKHQKPLLPGSKIFAPLRLCAFALKMTPPGDAAPDGAGKSFSAGGYKYFAPTALPGASSIPQRIGQATEINDQMPHHSRPTCVISFFKPQWIKPESRNPVAGIPAFPILIFPNAPGG
jgi:hypothetical protein